MSEQIPPPIPPNRLRTLPPATGLRVFVVFLLALLMLIPLFMVGKVVDGRNNYYQQALQKVAATWGSQQTLVGPLLVVPYVEHFTSVDTQTDENGESRVVSKDIYNDRTAVLLPETLEIRSDLKEGHQQSGIYDALVYTANLSLSGKFNHEAIQASAEGERRIQWDKAFVAIGLDDTRAIDTASSFFWNEGRIKLEPGSGIPKLLPTGFHIPLKVTGDSSTLNEFKLTLSLRGSDSLLFAPLGENTAIRMSSPWTHPNFEGNLLPDKQQVNEQGFHAEWDIPHLVRNYPQYWVQDDAQTHDLRAVTAGVSLYEPVTLYGQIGQTLRYGALLIGLIFLVLLAFEISQKRRLNGLQYLLVGVGLLLFYLILLAVAEQVGFLYAYLAAAAATTLIVTLYAGTILRNQRQTLLLCLLLAALYGLQYLLLQMADYALMAGVGLSIVATGILMYVTRHLQQAD